MAGTYIQYVPVGRALISGSASVAQRNTSAARPRRAPAGAPQNAMYARIYARNQSNSKSAFERLPNLEKACIMMLWNVLEKKRAVLI